MPQNADFALPPDLSRPVNDGAADHLVGMPIPNICLPSTFGGLVDLSRLSSARTVVYCYPMTGVPEKSLPRGWDGIPGALSCTHEICGFQEHYGLLLELQAEVFGLSTQTKGYQDEMANQLHLPYEILSDVDFEFCDALRLPAFEVNGMRFLKPLALIIRGGRIEHVFYPVSSPSEIADQVVQWLADHPVG